MVRIRFTSLLVLLIALLAATAGPGTAGEPDGTLEIQVVDPEGILPGAAVELRTGKIKAVTLPTDENGSLVFTELRCDKVHAIEVSFPGFASRAITGIEICGKAPVSLVVCLDEEVYCRSHTKNCRPVIDLSKMRVSTIYTPEFMQDLPGMRGDPSGRPPKKAKAKGKRCEQPVTVISSSPRYTP
jgi:hypothetical protein